MWFSHGCGQQVSTYLGIRSVADKPDSVADYEGNENDKVDRRDVKFVPVFFCPRVCSSCLMMAEQPTWKNSFEKK